MENRNHNIPPGNIYEKDAALTWVDCWCGLKHSNRTIPGDYWKKYKKTKKNETRYNCGIILRKNKKLFIVQNYNNYYGFPKGSVKDSYESFKDCAIREFYEETGFLLDVDKYKMKKLLLKNEKTSMTYIFFVITVPEEFDIQTFPLDDMEITAYGWVKYDNIHDLKISNITSRAIENILKLKT